MRTRSGCLPSGVSKAHRSIAISTSKPAAPSALFTAWQTKALSSTMRMRLIVLPRCSGPASLRLQLHQRAHRVDDLAQSHWLVDEDVGAGLHGHLARGIATRGHRDDRKLALLELAPDGRDHAGAVEDWQIDVDDDGVECR